MINIKNFDLSKISVDEKSQKNVLIYYIGYVTRDSKDMTINGMNTLDLIIGKVNGYFKEINGNKYLTLVPANETKNNNEKIRRIVE